MATNAGSAITSSDTGKEQVRQAVAAITPSTVMPHAPLADGTVPELRKQLDLAVFTALGMSRGEAAVLLDRIYHSYARWRAAVEEVEDQMQEHRRALARRGGNRNENPAVRAARIVWDEMSPATVALLGGLFSGPAQLVDPHFPRGADINQEALFDVAVVRNAEGQPLDLGDRRRVDLARYIRNLGLTGLFPLPTNAALCERLLSEATAAEAAFLEEAARRARVHVSDNLVDQVVTYARRAWVVSSTTAIREQLNTSDDAVDPSLFDTEGLVPPFSAGETDATRANRRTS